MKNHSFKEYTTEHNRDQEKKKKNLCGILNQSNVLIRHEMNQRCFCLVPVDCFRNHSTRYSTSASSGHNVLWGLLQTFPVSTTNRHTMICSILCLHNTFTCSLCSLLFSPSSGFCSCMFGRICSFSEGKQANSYFINIHDKYIKK